MQKVLVTGGMGFIGNYLVHHLLSLGIEVLVLDKSIYKPTFFNIQQATIIEGDVLSHELLHECLQEVDTCFHLAALSSIPACARDWIFSHENNVLAFNGLLEELRRVTHPVKLVYASSSAVYGSQNKAACKTESDHLSPDSMYGADKLSNEIYAELMGKLHGIYSIGLRLFNVYGPGQVESNPYSGVITKFKNALQKKNPITIFGDGHQTRDFIFIDDVVRAFITAAETPITKHGVFNICSGQSTSILELANSMMHLSNITVPILYGPARVGETYHSLGNKILAEQELKFCATTSIKLGLSHFFQNGLTLEPLDNR